MDIDLNQEPFDQARGSVMRFDSILSEIESTHGRIEERIRHLEAVTARARQRQRWRHAQTPFHITNVATRLRAANNQDEDSADHEMVNFISEEGTTRSDKSDKRDTTCPIAKALEIDTDKTGSDAGGFFDCNICLDMARDPILTCCGHLFCWACFYQLLYAYSNAKECPVCRGEVTDSSIIPIYGHGNVTISPGFRPKDKAKTIPPRPRAQRIESMRQQFVGQQSITIPIEERFQRFSHMIGAMREQVRLETPQNAAQRNNSLSNSRSSSHHLLLAEIENQQIHAPHFSTLLLEGATSFSSVPSALVSALDFSTLLLEGATSFSSVPSALISALDSAERLAEDLASYIHGHENGRNNNHSPLAVNGESLSSTSTIQRSEDAATEFFFEDLPVQSSIFTNTMEATLISSETQNTGVSGQMRTSMYPNPSTSSARGDFLRVSDPENGVSRDSRRRRLN